MVRILQPAVLLQLLYTEICLWYHVCSSRCACAGDFLAAVAELCRILATGTGIVVPAVRACSETTRKLPSYTRSLLGAYGILRLGPSTGPASCMHLIAISLLAGTQMGRPET